MSKALGIRPLGSTGKARQFNISPFKQRAHLNNNLKFSSYLKENTMRLHYKD
jgi:hypothetical protein